MEAVKDSAPLEPPADWSDEDKVWFATQCNEKLKGVAIRWKRPMIELVMLGGGSSHALGRIAAQGRGNREIARALTFLQQSLDKLVQKGLAAAGHTVKDFHECNAEINISLALQTTQDLPANAKVSKGGIILDS